MEVYRNINLLPTSDDLPNSDKSYEGLTPKNGVIYKGANYILKYNSKNNLMPVSEFLVSSVLRQLGFPCQEVELCQSNSTVAPLIKDFTTNGYFLHAYGDLGESSANTSLSSKDYTYESVLYVVSKLAKPFMYEGLSPIEFFWFQYFFDAIFANRDRHLGNWGYLKSTGDFKLAPVFDNGACLFPDVGRALSEFKSNPDSFIAERRERYPASLLRLPGPDGTRRSNYNEVISGAVKVSGVREYLNTFCNRYTLSSLLSATSNALTDIDFLIDPNLSVFYYRIIEERYNHLILRNRNDQGLRRMHLV